MPFVSFFQNTIQQWGLFGFFISTLLEELIIPLPSSLIMLGGGFFLIEAETVVVATREVLLKLVPFGTLGVMTGSFFLYAISKHGEEFAVKRFSKYLGISWLEVKKIEKYFQKQYADELILLFLRAVPLFPGSLTAIFAGLIRMPVAHFLIFGAIGSAIRVFLMGFIGWYVKELYVVYAYRFENLSNWFTILFIVLLVVGYLSVKLLRGKFIK